MHGIEFHFILCFGKWNRFQGQHSCKHCRVNFNSNFALWTEPTQWSSVFWAHAISLFFDSTKRLSHSKLISCSSIASDWWFPQSAWISASVDQCSSSHFQFLTPPTRCPHKPTDYVPCVHCTHKSNCMRVQSSTVTCISWKKTKICKKMCKKLWQNCIMLILGGTIVRNANNRIGMDATWQRALSTVKYPLRYNIYTARMACWIVFTTFECKWRTKTRIETARETRKP